MKAIKILLLSLIFSNLLAIEPTETKVESKVKEVTVFLKGAQVVRKKALDLKKGKTIVRFVNLSPYIDAKSVQVKAEGDLMVLSVNHQQNYVNKMKKPVELNKLEQELENVRDKVEIEETHLSIIKEELSFLQANKEIGGKNEQVNIANLQQAADFFSSKLTALKMKEISRSKTIKDLNEKQRNLQKQINTISSKKEYPTGEVFVKVDAKQAGKFSIELNYIVGNAGWFPSYDVRAKNISEPIQLIYKANVKQDTKVDWNNVKLKFSSANPNVSGVAPELKTYYLNYNSMPPRYKLTSNLIRGKVVDGKGEPLIGANILVDGSTIGTVSDADGNYSITIPNYAKQLKYSFIGYDSKTKPINGEVVNVMLEESSQKLEEVVTVAYGSRVENALQGRIAGLSVDKKKNIRIRGTSSRPIPTVRVEKQTSVDFEIKDPYTIKSDNKNYTVDMDFYDLPAFYQYYCVPKVNKDAFLIANIIDWEKYNLLEGEANVFFEDTYIGKTLMDVRFASDTLEISLGRDKKVSVHREKIKDFTQRQFFGNRKEETRAWKTTVKNNKNQEINMIILDQVPVSTNDDIEVDIQTVSGARLDSETGELEWQLELEPGDQEELELKYSVKFPKNRVLIVE